MSVCQQPHGNATLGGDPTNTLQLREDFITALQRRFFRLRAQVRSKIGYENDAAHLMESAPGSVLIGNDADDEDRDRFEFTTRDDLLTKFERWLRDQINAGVLEPVRLDDVQNGSHWTASYIRSGYEQGWQQSTGLLLQLGASVRPLDENRNVLQLPTPRRQLQDLYRRAFENLRNITDDMATVLREELAQALVEGVNPREAARRLTDELEDIEATRARVLARTEIINSHATASLDRYEAAGTDGVAVSGEFTTAGDRRVCPLCEAIEGQVFGIDEMRTATFQFEASDDQPSSLSGSWPVRPPVHPQCRCAVLPVIQ